MSRLEWMVYVLSALITALNYFVPTLWNGVFNANTSNASQLYGSAIILIELGTLVFMTFNYVMIVDIVKKLRG